MSQGPVRRSRKRNPSATAVSRRKATRAAGDSVASDARRLRELRVLQGFRTIFASARKHDAEVRRIAGISGSQLWALSEIGSAAGMSVNDLSARMALHQTTASNLIYALAERKLIRRVRDEGDQRIVRLHKTLGVLLAVMRDKATAGAGDTLLGE
jgi:DNA-binding MarR family transcriptional regulator